ncbi:formylglycine-generating enzyme family protein [Candidatus Poribacteria bacterium]|nr:formylglycine-generating enzyme family protein [Candidatus Poribacteria bacterium]
MPESATPLTSVTARDGSEMLLIPAGYFVRGNDYIAGRAAFDEEKPRHRVWLDAYRIAKRPVTYRQYRRFVVETSHRSPAYWDDAELAADDHPVIGVSWDDASAYCAWAGLRLPTEAEWEKAARGTEGALYCWGDTWDPRRGNFDDDLRCDGSIDGYARTSPVGAYPQGASPYGCLDMLGNVWEWCADWFAEYGDDPETRNPKGPASSESGVRVLKGGSWEFASQFGVSCAHRNYFFKPEAFDMDIGFRPASDA